MRSNKNKELKIPNIRDSFLKKTSEERLKVLKPRFLKKEEDEAESLIRSKIDVRIIPPPFASEISEAKHARQQLKETIIKMLKGIQLKKELSKLTIPYRNDEESLTDYYRRLDDKVNGLLKAKRKQVLQQKNLVGTTGLVISLKKALEKHKKSGKIHDKEQKALVQKLAAATKNKRKSKKQGHACGCNSDLKDPKMIKKY